jgi:LacI family transcriptional regulator
MEQPRLKRATLNDVADYCGVSYQTVSRVINNSPNVSAATRHRVTAAVAALGYQPNKAAQALVKRRSYTIQMITYGLNYYGPSQMVISVEQAARAEGYQLALTNVNSLSKDEIDAVIDHLGDSDGILLIAPVQDAGYDALAEAWGHVPIVRIGSQVGAPGSSIIFDQQQGSSAATRYLIDLGHTRIGVLNGPARWYDAAARHAGVLATLNAYRLTPACTAEADWTAAGGYAACQQLLDTGVLFSALVVANDQMAIGAMRALREAGKRIPEDVSVVGFDDIPEAAYLEPPLTTVRQDFATLGRRCIEYLLARIAEPGMAPHQWVLAPELIIRASTAPLRS